MQQFSLHLCNTYSIFVFRMKRLGLLLFTAFFLMVSLGVSLNLHYCGGKLASISIDLPGDKCCCGDKDMKNCCSDASVSMAMDVDQQVTYPTSLELQIPSIVMAVWFEKNESETFVPQEINPNFPNPPPRPSHALRIEMGSLTYYG